MRPFLLLAALYFLPICQDSKSDYEQELQDWRNQREEKLRADNGWLSLVGRFPLQQGDNTFGTGPNNLVVFPSTLHGIGPEKLGSVQLDVVEKKVNLTLVEGVEFFAGENRFTGSRELGLLPADWVGLGRFRFQVISREGQYFLRLADNESETRQNFKGCQWYPADQRFKVNARYVPYPAGKTIQAINILKQMTEQPCAGFAEFQWNGETIRLDAIQEGEGLFFVFRDATAGETTYPAGRFISIEKRPGDNETFALDFNRAYNPPCAVSDYTTCPTAPPQNVLKFRVEAGERFR